MIARFGHVYMTHATLGTWWVRRSDARTAKVLALCCGIIIGLVVGVLHAPR